MELLRRWARRLGIALTLLIFATLVSALVVVLPFVRDDMALDQIVVAVILDWRDFGLPRATERLQYELDYRKIGMHVGDEHCVLEETASGVRRVQCDWTVDLAIPGSASRIPLRFGSKVEMDPSGELR
jgi:hypothetical protein